MIKTALRYCHSRMKILEARNEDSDSGLHYKSTGARRSFASIGRIIIYVLTHETVTVIYNAYRVAPSLPTGAQKSFHEASVQYLLAKETP